jgi:hypothetical protein
MAGWLSAVRLVEHNPTLAGKSISCVDNTMPEKPAFSTKKDSPAK